jgi:hypothetical protein
MLRPHGRILSMKSLNKKKKHQRMCQEVNIRKKVEIYITNQTEEISEKSEKHKSRPINKKLWKETCKYDKK